MGSRFRFLLVDNTYISFSLVGWLRATSFPRYTCFKSYLDCTQVVTGDIERSSSGSGSRRLRRHRWSNIVYTDQSLTIDPNLSIPLIRLRPLLKGISDDLNSSFWPLIDGLMPQSILRPSTETLIARSPGHFSSVVRSNVVMIANSWQDSVIATNN